MWQITLPNIFNHWNQLMDTNQFNETSYQMMKIFSNVYQPVY